MGILLKCFIDKGEGIRQMKKYIVLKIDIQSHQIVRCNAIELLESKGLSVAELARRGDISYTTLVVIIKEGYEPKEQSIAHIAKGFDMTLAEFFSSKGECILSKVFWGRHKYKVILYL